MAMYYKTDASALTHDTLCGILVPLETKVSGD